LIIISGYAPNYVPNNSFAKLLVGLVMGIGMAELSYRLVETPFLRLKSKLGKQVSVPHTKE
jgi:peptidoglycan/LPS O-acetylase OafA/YrhL